MRVDHLDAILADYHGRLIFHLSKLGYPDTVYPEESFRKDFDDCFVYGYITGTFVAQVRWLGSIRLGGLHSFTVIDSYRGHNKVAPPPPLAHKKIVNKIQKIKKARFCHKSMDSPGMLAKIWITLSELHCNNSWQSQFNVVKCRYVSLQVSI